MDFEQQQQNYLNTVRDMADEAAYNNQREQQYTDDQLLAMALGNIGEYIYDNSQHYVLIEEDPRNEEDYDTWEYGTEPLPQDHTWHSTSIDVEVSPSEAD
jgi:hypothetical protein